MMVREACHYALWQARLHAEVPVLLWIDSICINQADDNEKGHQVGMISTIFRGAEETLVCIGPHADDSEYVFARMDSMTAAFAEGTTLFRRDCHSCEQMFYGHAVVGSLTEDDPIHSLHQWATQLDERLDVAMNDLDERPYWSRMWIYPEVAMSRRARILCGGDSESMDVLRWLAGIFEWAGTCLAEGTFVLEDRHVLLWRRFSYNPQWYGAHGVMRQVIFAYFAERLGPLPRWLAYVRNGLERSYPSDAIYSALDMVDWDPHFNRPSVDYTKSAVSLTKEVLPHLSVRGMWIIRDVNLLLGLMSTDADCDESELRVLWAKRKSDGTEMRDSSLGGPVVTCTCDKYEPSQSAAWLCPQKALECVSSAQLRQGADGSLNVVVERDVLGRAWASMNTNRRRLLRKKAKASRVLCGIDAAGRSQGLVGLACQWARPGDHLIQISEGFERAREHLVLRHAWSDIYEIIGWAIINQQFGLVDQLSPAPLSERGHKKSSASASLHANKASAHPACFDLWLDAEDILTMTFPLGARYGKLTDDEMLRLTAYRFTRGRFSSFATLCSGLHPSGDHNAFSSCAQCVTGEVRRLCIHCGGGVKDPPPEPAVLPHEWDA